MADVSKINLYGESYNIKDTSARSTANSAKTAADSAASDASNALLTAGNANTTANTAVSNTQKLSQRSIDAAYNSDNESIDITRGISL